MKCIDVNRMHPELKKRILSVLDISEVERTQCSECYDGKACHHQQKVSLLWEYRKIIISKTREFVPHYFCPGWHPREAE